MRIKTLLVAGAVALSGLAITPSVAAPPSSMVTRTDDGYVMGNPKAPIKLVVLSSFGCSHCRILDDTMMQPLRRNWIDTGKVSLRYVPYGMFPTDVPALFLSECGDPKRFFDRSARIFKMQSQTGSTFRQASEASKAQIAKGPPSNVPRGLAILSGLTLNSPSVGVSTATYSKCLNDQTLRSTISKRQKLIESRYQFAGTPSIWINGKATNTGSSWPKLEAIIKSVSR